MTKDKLRQLTGDERLGQTRESEYLGAEDIDDGVEPVLTISGLWNGMVTLQRGKENKDVLTFAEERVHGIMQVRPLIVNSTNRKTLRKLFGDAKASTLVGKQIQLYVDHKVRDPQDGGFTDGIRVRPYKPRAPRSQPVPPCSDCGKPIQSAHNMTAERLAAYTAKNYGAPLCAACATHRREKAAEVAQTEATSDEKTTLNKEASGDGQAPGGDGGELL